MTGSLRASLFQPSWGGTQEFARLAPLRVLRQGQGVGWKVNSRRKQSSIVSSLIHLSSYTPGLPERVWWNRGSACFTRSEIWEEQVS